MDFAKVMKKIAVIWCIATFGFVPQGVLAAKNTLESVSLDQKVIIDGVEDAFWSNATPLTVLLNELPYEPSNGYAGMKEVEVNIRSVYDAENVYFLVRWEDPTMSLERFPWVKQQDGSWKQLMKKDQTGQDNTYYEDKFAFFWNIHSKGFVKKGCDKSCHITEDGEIDGVKDISSGRHYTANAGETIDMWHWKGARSNPVGQIDDQYMNSDRQENKGWGRHSDDKTGGGYANNHNADKTAPVWMNPEPSEDNRYWVLDATKVPFLDRFKAGDIVGGIVANPSTGSRGDINALGVWKNGVWTLEVKRKLVTEHENSATQDVQFSDLNKKYYFGMTVFDNSQTNHLYHKKSLKLTFSK